MYNNFVLGNVIVQNTYLETSQTLIITPQIPVVDYEEKYLPFSYNGCDNPKMFYRLCNLRMTSDKAYGYHQRIIVCQTWNDHIYKKTSKGSKMPEALKTILRMFVIYGPKKLVVYDVINPINILKAEV